MTLFQSVFVPMCLSAALLVLVRTGRGTIARRSGLFWACIWFAAAVLISHPSFTTIAASWFGIGRGADLLLYFAVLGGLSLALYFYGRQRRLETLITALIRREALREPRRGASGASTVA